MAPKKPIPEKRICPETGQEMTRGVRPVTFSYKGYSETVEMPGWYTADGKHGIYNSEDTNVSDAALLRLKAMAKEEIKQHKYEEISRLFFRRLKLFQVS